MTVKALAPYILMLAFWGCGESSSFSGNGTAGGAPQAKEELRTGSERSVDAGPEEKPTKTPAKEIDAEDDGEFSDRLEEQGAQTGAIQISLLWDNINDLDLHVVGPTGQRIYFGARRDQAGGFLDVDMNAGEFSQTPIENVFWTQQAALRGSYKIYVHHYQNRGIALSTPYKVRLKIGDKLKKFQGTVTGVSGAGGFGSYYLYGDGYGYGGNMPLPANAVLVHEFQY